MLVPLDYFHSVMQPVHVCVHVIFCPASYAQLSWMTECYWGGPCAPMPPLLTPGYHCAPVMINHVLQRLALSRREGTNHMPHYPGLVTPKQSGPRTPQAVAVWRERGRSKGIGTSNWKEMKNQISRKICLQNKDREVYAHAIWIDLKIFLDYITTYCKH